MPTKAVLPLPKKRLPACERAQMRPLTRRVPIPHIRAVWTRVLTRDALAVAVGKVQTFDSLPLEATRPCNTETVNP